MERVRWGIIGAGGIATRRTLPGMQECEFAEVVAMMDANRAAAEKAKETFGAKYVFDTEEEVLKCDEVEAVYIATPVFVHEPQVLAACEHKKHILVEKPLAGSLKSAKRMLKAVEDAGVFATEGYMMKFHDLNRKAREMVERGDLGKIVFCRGQLSCWYPPIEGAWRQIPEQGGGGALIDMATHIYDLLEWIVGPVREVFAYCDSLVHDYPVEDSATTLLHFENGCHGVVDTFFNLPDAAGQDRLELYGPLGSLQACGTIGQMPTGSMQAHLSEAGGDYDPQQSKDSLDVQQRDIPCEPINMYGAEVDYLSGCIRENKAPEMNTLEAGVRILKIALAAYESAKTGQSVKVD